MGWNVDLLGQFAAYDTAVARRRAARRGLLLHDAGALRLSGRSAAGGAGVRQGYKARYGLDPNFLGEIGYTAGADRADGARQRAGKDLTVDSLIKAMESIHDSTDIFGSCCRSARTSIMARPRRS